MSNEKQPLNTAEFEKAFKELQDKTKQNNQAIIMIPNLNGYDVVQFDADAIKAFIYFSVKDINPVTNT